jgi:hypothetical protein
MFFPELQLDAAKHPSTISAGTILLMLVGVYITYQAYRR